MKQFSKIAAIFLFLFTGISLLFIHCRKDPETFPDYPGWKVYDSNNSSLPDELWKIVADHSGVIWGISMYGKKLYKLENEIWNSIDIPNIQNLNPQNSAYELFVDQNNNIWVGVAPGYPTQEKGAVMKYNGSWTVYDDDQGFPSSYQFQNFVVDNNDNVWLSNIFGLIKYDGTNSTIYIGPGSYFPVNFLQGSTTISDSQVQVVGVDVDNSVWFGTMFSNISQQGQTALNHLADTTLSVFTTTNSGLPSNGIRCIRVESSGIKWFLTGQNQIVKYDNNQWTVFDRNNISLLSGVQFYYTESIVIDRNNVKWFCSVNSGLIRYDDQQWKVFNRHNSGIPSDKVYSVAVDSHNVVWITTDKGLASYKE